MLLVSRVAGQRYQTDDDPGGTCSGAAVRETRDFDEIYMPGIVQNAERNRLIAEAGAWGRAQASDAHSLLQVSPHGRVATHAG